MPVTRLKSRFAIASASGRHLRHRFILLLRDGVPYRQDSALLDTTAATISCWKERFLQHPVAGLMDAKVVLAGIELIQKLKKGQFGVP